VPRAPRRDTRRRPGSIRRRSGRVPAAETLEDADTPILLRPARADRPGRPNGWR
jgi:hypothetical protein